MSVLKQRTLSPALLLCAVSAFGDFSVSGVFRLNTLSPTPVLSSVFTANTMLLKGAQTSGNFLCSTIQTDQQISAVFTGGTLQKLYSSGVFFADTMTVPVDTNTNGLPNIWEMRYFGGITAANVLGDDDRDGVNNLSEFISGTNPLKGDTDGDGFSDGIEIWKGSDPLDPESIPKIDLLLLIK
jgi:hypothetical protein